MVEKFYSNYRSELFIQQAMNAWGSTVYKLAFAQTTSRMDAEDIYQEVFVRLFKDTSVFRDKEHLKAWLLTVTINCCRDLARSGWRKKVTNIEEYAEYPDECSENSTASQEASHDLSRALKALPEDLRAVTHLYYYEGYSTEDIARIMDVKSSTIRSRMQRARERLKTLLGGAGYGTNKCIYRQDEGSIQGEGFEGYSTLSASRRLGSSCSVQIGSGSGEIDLSTVKFEFWIAPEDLALDDVMIGQYAHRLEYQSLDTLSGQTLKIRVHFFDGSVAEKSYLLSTGWMSIVYEFDPSVVDHDHPDSDKIPVSGHTVLPEVFPDRPSGPCIYVLCGIPIEN